jgi:hypothetical protein
MAAAVGGEGAGRLYNSRPMNTASLMDSAATAIAAQRNQFSVQITRGPGFPLFRARSSCAAGTSPAMTGVDM